MSAINNQVQVSCMRSIKTEPRSVGDLQEDLKDNVILKTESAFCSDTDMTYCSPISCMQVENISAPAYIKPDHAWNIPESNWKHEDAVKLELNPQDSYCIKTEQVPGEKLRPIKAESAAHIEQSDCSHENAVKVEYHCQDVTCSIKTEQDPVQCAKTEEQLVFKQEQDHTHMVKTETGWPGPHAETVAEVTIDTATEIQKKQVMIHSDLKDYSCTSCSVVVCQDHTHMVKTETGWPGQYAMWHENCQEMSVARCITPEVTDIMRENQHQTTPTVTEVPINAETEIHKKQMMIHSVLKAYGCSPCSVLLERIDTLKEQKEANSNKRSHHSVERPHKCNVCDAAFKTLDVLKKHMLTHSNVRPHQCTLCPLACKRLDHLKQHMLTHSNVRTHQCSICNKAFLWPSNLKEHMVTHRDERPHQCSICNGAFKLSGNLKKHMGTHKDERPHQCSICNSAFKLSIYLKKHMVTHKDERPHQCSICNRAFKLSRYLKVHMLNHSDERPHQCCVCHLAFKTTGSLKQHMVNHWDVKPCPCRVCRKMFRRPFDLKMHMRTHRDVTSPVPSE
ncbi:zinc finger protein 184-like [Pomacea canaliculata]|uniref:zinc finger protein 184-like n=1 Tax=Pomacea canaliculata TaxID=400727 RepID=UPI000D73A4FB|nr:zinc finger protein 184-like [Pomacea canaliculata]XP_025112035.1 zinc finger protein 184-like [Pomacea canaliculata]XP_025112036.1 zinc finger protein 184-like [Pomacea canaliculata]